MRTTLLLFSTLFVTALSGCERAQPLEGGGPAGEGGWLYGSAAEKFDTLADQLGGFDRTMMEVAYRYVELYWAGEAENWEFAKHHIEEMREAMHLGFQRRPARVQSAQPFMQVALPQLEEAVVQGDLLAFRERFDVLTANCTACHATEQVGFIHVERPSARAWPWPMRPQ
jgi:hypothetical protein